MEKEESLVDWLDRNIDERMRRLGFTLQETISSKQGRQETTPVSGTISFLKGETAKKAAELFQKEEEERL